MGLALHERVFDGFTKLDAPRHERAALEQLRKELGRIRLELAELKRIGSRQGLAELTSDALTFSMRIRRLETSCSPDCSTR
jgi:hypothetical protein